MTTTAANLTLSFESILLVYSNAIIPFQERIFAQNRPVKPNIGHFLAKSRPPHGRMGIHGHQETLETSMEVPILPLYIQKSATKKIHCSETPHGRFVWHSQHARTPDFPEISTSTTDQSPYCTKTCSNALSKFCDNGLGITSDNETVSSKQGNLSDIELTPWMLPRRRFFRQKISISGNRRPLRSKMGHVRMLKPLLTRCVVLRRNCMAPAAAICPN